MQFESARFRCCRLFLALVLALRGFAVVAVHAACRETLGQPEWRRCIPILDVLPFGNIVSLSGLALVDVAILSSVHTCCRKLSLEAIEVARALVRKNNHARCLVITETPQIHQQMRHPRIVNLTDVFEICCDSFATVLDYCRGTDLECLLRERKQLPERDARALILQVARGLQYLNTAQVVNQQAFPHGEVFLA